jgi:choline dehydrogenase
VAARLAEDPASHVLLVEAGKPARGLSVTMPAALPLAYQRKDIQWGYESGPEPHLDGRTIDEKAGKVVGGSSSINAMIFNRGNPMDYDGWATAGLPAWDYAHCLPYFKRMETFEEGADEWRGGDGPLKVSRCRAALDQPNLHLLTHAPVEKVLIENGRAVGVVVRGPPGPESSGPRAR